MKANLPQLQDRAALLTELRSKPQFVELEIARGTDNAINFEERVTWLAFCSETPYDRWWGREILDCGPESVRMDRLNNQAAVLVNHDPDQHVGVVVRAKLEGGGIGRAKVRFGRGALASEVLQDIADGIRTKVSVGYQIHDLVLERQDDNLSTYRVTDWEPFEISIVSVPADDTVGIGRSAPRSSSNGVVMQRAVESEDAQQMFRRRERALAKQIGVTQQFDKIPTDDKAEFQAHVDDLVREFQLDQDSVIRTLGPVERYYQGWREKSIRSFHSQWQDTLDPTELHQRMTRAIAGNKSVDSFRLEIKAMLENSRHPPTNTGQLDADNPGYLAGARVNERYSSLANLKGPGAEKRAYAAGQFFKSIAGDKNAARWCEANNLVQHERGLGTGVFSAGGALLPDPIANDIINLVEQYGVFRKFAYRWPMDTSSLSIPVKSTGMTVSAVGEGSATQTSDPAFSMVGLMAKEFAGGCRVHRNLLEDSPVALGDFVIGEMSLALARKEDDCGFVGTGISTHAGIRGVVTLLEAAAQAGGAVDAASAHDTFGEIDVTDLTNLMGRLPEYARAGSAWYLSSTARDMIFTRLMMTAGGNTVETMRDGAGERFMGYPVRVTQVMPAGGTTAYNDRAIILFGNLSQAAAFGDRRGMVVDIDSSRFVEYREVYFQATERFDIVNHHVGTATEAGPIVALLGTT